jgi:hypothetical protein
MPRDRAENAGSLAPRAGLREKIEAGTTGMSTGPDTDPVPDPETS